MRTGSGSSRNQVRAQGPIARGGEGNGTSSSRGTGSSISGSSSGPSSWRRRQGISPHDDFGTPLRDPVALAAHNENGRCSATGGSSGHGEDEEYSAEGEILGRLDNAALPLGRHDELPVYTPTSASYTSAFASTPAAARGVDQQDLQGPEHSGDQRQGDSVALAATRTGPAMPAQVVSVRIPDTPGTYNTAHAQNASVSSYFFPSRMNAGGAESGMTGGSGGEFGMMPVAVDGGDMGESEGDSSQSGSRLDFPLPPLVPWNVGERERESTVIASE